MTAWQTVRFVDEPKVPHRRDLEIHRKRWRIIRGKPVKIGPPLTKEQFDARYPGIVKRMHERGGCDCELFFPVADETVESVGNDKGQRWVCRRMLEMD
jgi:hypothetical protein